MRLELLERHSEGNGPLHRLDARPKLVFVLFYIIGVVATPVGWWRTLTAEALGLAFVIGLTGAPPRELLRRWLGFFVLVGFLALMVARAHPNRAEFGLAQVALTIIAKNSMAFLATLSLVNVTPIRKLLVGLRRLGLPIALVATLQFMYRYLHVLTDELERMVQARRSRTFRRSGRLDWVLLTGLIGILFLRAFERGERVHSAMLARGWDGTVRSLDDGEDC